MFRRLPGEARRWRSRPGMIFVSDYDGDPDEYLAAFGIGIEGGMRWTFGSYDGFPGPRPTAPFIEYVAQGSSESLLRYSAYPGATVRDIDSALEVVDQLKRLRSQVLVAGIGRRRRELTEPELELAYKRLVRTLTLARVCDIPSWWAGIWQALRHRPTVSPLVVSTPIEPQRLAEVSEAVRALAQEKRSPFAEVAGLHFARVAIIAAPALRRSGRPGNPHLLVCGWVDAPAAEAVKRLAKALAVTGGRGRTPADALWSGCIGYPGPDDPDGLARWLSAHRMRFSLFLDSRSGVAVEQIQAALRLREEAMAIVIAHEGRPRAEASRALAGLEL